MKKVLVISSESCTNTQMAEGYLQFYGTGLIEVLSVGLGKQEVHELAVNVMKEDGIIIAPHCLQREEEIENIIFDYVITLCQTTQKALPEKVKHKKTTHWNIDSVNTSKTQEEQLADFLDLRERIKEYAIRFVGKHLSMSGLYSFSID